MDRGCGEDPASGLLVLSPAVDNSLQCLFLVTPDINLPLELTLVRFFSETHTDFVSFKLATKYSWQTGKEMSGLILERPLQPF